MAGWLADRIAAVIEGLSPVLPASLTHGLVGCALAATTAYVVGSVGAQRSAPLLTATFADQRLI